jgi:V-type H+-transporting ATPase subunit d
MDMLTFNADHGYLEAIVRGLKATLLRRHDYTNLAQCETLEDMRTILNSTDYATWLQNEPAPLQTQALFECLTNRLVHDFEDIRSQAYAPLSTFLDYITYPYMIDNLVLLLMGVLRNRDLSELLDKCHPLGVFEGMPALAVVTTPEELYREILVDTPLAPYFAECVSVHDLTEMNVEIIRNLLYKAYLADFYHLCVERIGGTTGIMMAPLIAFEADRRMINITLNSLDTALRKDERMALFPRIPGGLDDEVVDRLGRADDLQTVALAIDQSGSYRSLFQKAAEREDRSLEDQFLEQEMKLLREAFDVQFHYGVFYAYFRMREQEIRNLAWIGECITQKQNAHANRVVLIL